MKDREKIFKIAPLGAWIHVVLTNDIHTYRKSMTTKLGFPHEDLSIGADGLHTWHYDLYPAQNWILLNHGSKLEIIAHEVNHAAETIDDYFMIKSREFRAYLQGYLTEEIYKFVNKNSEQTC